MDTLIYNGQEKALADWGICDDFEFTASNKGKHTITFTAMEPFDSVAGPKFAYLGAVTVWVNRTSVGSGGSILFKGYFDDPKQNTSEGDEEVQYQAHNVWWLMEQSIFKQQRKQVVTVSPPVSITLVVSEIFLGETPLGVHMTVAAQITEVIGWFNEMFNPTRRGNTLSNPGLVNPLQDWITVGTIEPQILAPISRVNTIFCAEAINSTLRAVQDAVIVWDYTTTIPTINVRQLSKWDYTTVPPTFINYTNLPEVIVPVTPAQESAIQLQSQNARVMSGVIIYYTSTSLIDGKTYPAVVVDSYPKGVAGLTDVTDWTPFHMSHYIELSGSRLDHLSADITASAIAPLLTGSATDQRNWWIAHDRTLNDSKIDQSSITVANTTIVDDNGNPVNTSYYANELQSPMPEWVPEDKIVATVKSELTYKKYRDDAHKTDDVHAQNRAVHQRIVLTTATTQTYKVTSHFESAEPVPQNVAMSVYRSGAALQYAGEITLSNKQILGTIYVGCRLKLVGVNHTFSNLLVQSVTLRPHYGETRVQYGPSAPVDANRWVEQARMTRARIIYNMPSGRADGSGAASGPTTDLTATAPKDNTAHNIGGFSYHGVLFQQQTTGSGAAPGAGTGATTGGTGSP